MPRWVPKIHWFNYTQMALRAIGRRPIFRLTERKRRLRPRRSEERRFYEGLLRWVTFAMNPRSKFLTQNPIPYGKKARFSGQGQYTVDLYYSHPVLHCHPVFCVFIHDVLIRASPGNGDCNMGAATRKRGPNCLRDQKSPKKFYFLENECIFAPDNNDS